MKTAKEMFEELGYVCAELHDELNDMMYFEKEEECGDYGDSIGFNFRSKTFYALHWYYGDEGIDANAMNVNIPTFKAIHQQMKELHWIED